MTVLTIGRLAEAAGVHVETIRYYERRGLLPVPPRTASGYRQYSESEVRRLELIRRAKDLGFSLSEIAVLLGEGGGTDGAVGGGAAAEVRVRRAASEKLVSVEGELRALARVRERLLRLVETCDEGDGEGCTGLVVKGSGA